MKNLDLAAGLTMLFALLLEGATYLAQDESLLGQLPPWLGPIVLAAAALARWRMAQPKPVTPAAALVEKLEGEPAVPQHVELDVTPILDEDDLPLVIDGVTLTGPAIRHHRTPVLGDHLEDEETEP